MSWPFLQNDSFLAFAHRGGNLATENTVEAFSSAEQLGYIYMETDVHATSDGVVVVHHDASLNRLMGKPDYIADMTWDELRQLKFPGGEQIPRLDEVLKTFPALRFNIEPKSDASVDKLAQVIADAAAIDRVCIGSFSNSRVRRMQEVLGPDLCTSPGGKAIPFTMLRAVVSPNTESRYACVQIPPAVMPGLVAKPIVQRLKAANLQVHLWTLNDRTDIEHALEIDVDGIISDEIVLLKDILSSQQRW